MSRTIDTTDIGSLSEDEIRYLAERDQLPKDLSPKDQEMIRKMLQPDEVKLEDRAHTGDANTNGISKEAHEALIARNAELEAELDAERQKNLTKSESIVGDYDGGWTNDLRRDEIEKREMNPSGLKKAGQIAVLKASDEAGGGAIQFTVDEDSDPIDSDGNLIGDGED